MPKLTKRIVDAAELREKQYTIWCSELRGFGVFVNPTGKRSYFVDYRNEAGARRRMSIGVHGKITTEEARKIAILTLGNVVRGDDPAQARVERRTAVTVSQLCDDYVEAADRGLIIGKRGQPKKASTMVVDKGRIERHIKPLLGKKKVKDLTAADINAFIRDVTLGKTATEEKTEKLRGRAVVTGGRGAATRTAGLLGGILSFAVASGIIERNPAQGVRKPAYQQKDRRLVAEEYKRLGAALVSAANTGETWQAVSAIWMLALTGCRKDEVISLEWREVDTGNSCLRLTDSKTGASVRPIGSPALGIISQIERGDGDFVFPAIRGDGHFGGIAGAWKRIRERAGLGNEVTLHTLRHSYASVAGDCGFAESTIGALLGHSGNSITSRYVHRLDTVLVSGADTVAKKVLRQMRGHQP